MANWKNKWKALWNPDMYHGWGKETNYFEGWYFKFVSPDEKQAFAVIPGISKSADDPHAFIQVLDGKKCTASYHRFEPSDFIPSPDKFEVQLGNNFFSKDYIKLDLAELRGELHFANTTPWPKMLYAPGIMGWFSFVPFMECYHGVVSLHHTISGSLDVYNKKTDFNKGIGYIEKDWGQSFPSGWIWMQTNHFDKDYPVSFMASVANIPWLGNYFVGYIVGLWIDGKLYRFATYTGAKMLASFGDDTVNLAFKDRTHRLVITGHKAEGGDLVSPISGHMTGKVNESMQAKVSIELYKNEQLVFSGTGSNAGMEVAGETEKLLTDKWRR